MKKSLGGMKESVSEGKEYLKDKLEVGLDYITEKKDIVVNKVIEISETLHSPKEIIQETAKSA